MILISIYAISRQRINVDNQQERPTFSLEKTLTVEKSKDLISQIMKTIHHERSLITNHIKDHDSPPDLKCFFVEKKLFTTTL